MPKKDASVDEAVEDNASSSANNQDRKHDSGAADLEKVCWIINPKYFKSLNVLACWCSSKLLSLVLSDELLDQILNLKPYKTGMHEEQKIFNPYNLKLNKYAHQNNTNKN